MVVTLICKNIFSGSEKQVIVICFQANLRKASDEDEPVSPCSIVSITSSKDSVARSIVIKAMLCYVMLCYVMLQLLHRLEVHLDEEDLIHTRVLGLALALLSGVLMTVYSRCCR